MPESYSEIRSRNRAPARTSLTSPYSNQMCTATNRLQGSASRNNKFGSEPQLETKSYAFLRVILRIGRCSKMAQPVTVERASQPFEKKPPTILAEFGGVSHQSKLLYVRIFHGSCPLHAFCYLFLPSVDASGNTIVYNV